MEACLFVLLFYFVYSIKCSLTVKDMVSVFSVWFTFCQEWWGDYHTVTKWFLLSSSYLLDILKSGQCTVTSSYLLCPEEGVCGLKENNRPETLQYSFVRPTNALHCSNVCWLYVQYSGELSWMQRIHWRVKVVYFKPVCYRLLVEGNWSNFIDTTTTSIINSAYCFCLTS